MRTYKISAKETFPPTEPKSHEHAVKRNLSQTKCTNSNKRLFVTRRATEVRIHGT